MSVGVRALAANYAALQTTGHNIANANVAGYSRQQVELATASGQFTGSGFFGNGVDVTTVSRAHNQFLTREAASALSLSSMDAARLQHLTRLENIFQSGELGLGHATSQLMSAMVDLASRPGDMATRQVVLARAGDLASRFAQAGAALDGAQDAATAALGTAIGEVNGLASSIADVNQRIAALKGLGQPANDLLDERDRLISRLSEHLQVTTIEAQDGTLGVFFSGGQRLVLGTEATRLKLLQDDSDASRAAVGLDEVGSVRQLDATTFGGSLGGILRFQNDDLVAARNLVGNLAAAVAGAVNEQQTKGLTLRVPYGQVPAEALFGIGPSLALAHAANARAGNGNPLGVVTLTVVDAGALQPSEYDLAEDSAGSGNWILTRRSDGSKTAVNSGDIVDGMRIDFSAAPQAGDRFLLQPVTRAANGMARLLGDPRDLAASSALLAHTAPSNTGSVGVASLNVNAAPLPVPDATTRITFTNNSGAYTWELFDASNTPLASGSASWQSGQPLPLPPLDLNGFTLQLTGMPRTGDIVTVEPTPASAVASNNGNALALQALRERGIVAGRTATDAWSSAMAEIGVRVQTGRTSADISGAASGQAEMARSSQAGVNLDEEAARLIQYQQSYQAAAKVLQIAQSIFDTLLDAAGR